MTKNQIYHSKNRYILTKETRWLRKKKYLINIAIGAEFARIFVVEKISRICNKSEIRLYMDESLSI